MKIVNADLQEFESGLGRGLVRSRETQALVDAINSLDKKTAKAVMIENGDTVNRVRSRIRYAAKIAGKPVKTVAKKDRVLFALSARRRRS